MKRQGLKAIMMKKYSLLTTVVIILSAGPAFAEDVTVTYTIPPVATLTTGGDPDPFVLSDVDYGNDRFNVVRSALSIDVAYNGSSSKKITASISSALGDGATLSFSVDYGGCTIGTAQEGLCQVLSQNNDTFNIDLVTGIANASGTVLTTLHLSADFSAAVVTNQTKTLTITLADQS